MRLSTRGYYGLKAMFDLAQHYGPNPITLKSVAQRQRLSEHYLEQLMSMLRKVGLVKSFRGSQGGYILAREPSQITVGEIVRALEGPIAPVYCVNEEEPGGCDESEYCITRTVWVKVRDGIVEILDSISLGDLCREAEEAKRARKAT